MAKQYLNGIYLLHLHNGNINLYYLMEYKKTSIEGVYIIEPKVFNDARGYFFEAWKKSDFEINIGHFDFIQNN